MRNYFSVASMVLVVFASMVLAKPAQAQVSSAQVLAQTIAAVSYIEDKNEDQVLNIQIAVVTKGEKTGYSTELEKGNDYIIYAIGDKERVQDLDVEILDENDNVVAKDDDKTNVGICRVSPRWTGDFVIRVNGYRMSHDDAFYSIIVTRED